MRKTLIAATSLALLGAYQVPAQAAAPDAPTDVQVSWSDIAKKTVKVTWKDNGEKNHLGYQLSAGATVTLPLQDEAAGGDNTVLLPIGSSTINQPKLRLVVWAEDSSGAVSGQTPTVWFDTFLAALPVLTNAEVLADQSLRLTWRRISDELTPGDPLDIPGGATLAVGRWTTTTTQPAETFPAADGSTTLTVPPRPRPYLTRFQTHNEWGTHTSSLELTFAPMGAGLTIDPVAVYGQTASYKVVVGAQRCVPAKPTCSYSVDPSVVSQLQSRANAGRPWKTIGTFTNLPPRFDGGIRSYGSTEYRLYVPAWKQLSTAYGRVVTAATSTSVRRSATKADLHAGFNKSTAQVGQLVQATVTVKPAGGGKASLQWLDGKVWRTTAYIPLSKGVGKLSIKASGRGTTKTWRVALPQLTWYGKTIIATTSTPFKLTVR